MLTYDLQLVANAVAAHSGATRMIDESNGYVAYLSAGLFAGLLALMAGGQAVSRPGLALEL